MLKKIIMDTIGWGFILWLIGYGLGMVFFVLVPQYMIGWFVLPIMTPITVYVALKRFKNSSEPALYYLTVAITWALIAVVFDYLFIVKAFNVQNYYDFDVFIYYILAFLIPLFIGLKYGRTNKV
ncbi:MAG: hypothetical protein WA277_14070 [Nitrospirota bacterium]